MVGWCGGRVKGRSDLPSGKSPAQWANQRPNLSPIGPGLGRAIGTGRSASTTGLKAVMARNGKTRELVNQ